MHLEKQRLAGLINYTKQSAKLRSRAVFDYVSHGIFSCSEEMIQVLPEVKFDLMSEGGEFWLEVPRLLETEPPKIENLILEPWVELNEKPENPPILKEAIVNIQVIKPDSDIAEGEDLLLLANQPNKDLILAEFSGYLKDKWGPWAQIEQRRAKTRELYKKLYYLKQQLEGSLSEGQLEFVLGIGIALWKKANKIIQYPLLTQMIEISLDSQSLALRISPRAVSPSLEVAAFMDDENLGIHEVEEAFERFYTRDISFSPFDSTSFEPILRSAVSFLDASAVYYPDVINDKSNRTQPKLDEKLVITDTWILLARPRTSSLIVHDLERFEKKIDSLDHNEIPGAVSVVVTEPTEELIERVFPTFRGLSINGNPRLSNDGSSKPNELYFPLPFNNEQVRIIQLLETAEGVVVQGPPGTGKTHTIANVICHYLALGKKVLVTSMKEPALGVLQKKIPDKIRPLAVSLLSSDREGMRQFEDAIRKMALEIQVIDRRRTEHEIRISEEEIDKLHAVLTQIDLKIEEWAYKNLSEIVIDQERLSPIDAAMELRDLNLALDWIPDRLHIGAKFNLQFNDEHIKKLRSARIKLGNNLIYLNKDVPAVNELPNSSQIASAHQDLASAKSMQEKVGSVLSLATYAKDFLVAAEALEKLVKNAEARRKRFAASKEDWHEQFVQKIQESHFISLLETLDTLIKDAREINNRRMDFVARPVECPESFDTNPQLISAVTNLALGKNPFGLLGVFTKGPFKQALAQVKIVLNKPETPVDWMHVGNYLKLKAEIKSLCIKWNALAIELALPSVEAGPRCLEEILVIASSCEELREEIYQSKEILQAAATLFTEIEQNTNELTDAKLQQIAVALTHHLRQSRLLESTATKDDALQKISDKNGPIVEVIRNFFAETFGNPATSPEKVQSSWLELISDLQRVKDLRNELAVVGEITALIESSGAPLLAEKLRTQPTLNHLDSHLPDNWQLIWRHKRLQTHLNELNGLDDLKRLFKLREQHSQRLADVYQDVVTKRTWLRLADNATPKIKSALQSFVASVKAIGKGTGKRAMFHRINARKAAEEASLAIPCWIMPHYRISESLPAEFGYFDLVIIDEASQSDLSALPALLRAKKVLVVGDDKQVSPDAVGIDINKVQALMDRYLINQVETFKPQFSSERSIYDLFKVVFADTTVMLREHFRCVGPIIEYSKREFYNHELHPLRLPKRSERLEPSLIDVWVKDGIRKANDTNQAEARYIVDEIKKLVNDERYAHRTFGVVSLLGHKQALHIFQLLENELGLEKMERHNIACGDAKTFQGKERDIMFLSLVVSKNNAQAVTREAFAQRFNVAASRARDRMYLVRSIRLEDLSPKDELRRGLLEHFSAPFRKDEQRVSDLQALCESPFELEVYTWLTERGYFVTPQVTVGAHRIDLVVEGEADNRLAIELDGDKYHGPDKWESDIQRQRILERAGWKFWRCFASTFVMMRQEVLEDLVVTLSENGIKPLENPKFEASAYVEKIEYIYAQSVELEEFNDVQI